MSNVTIFMVGFAYGFLAVDKYLFWMNDSNFRPPVVERSAQVLALYPSFVLVLCQLPCSYFGQLTSRLNLSCPISHKHTFDERDIREPILFFVLLRNQNLISRNSLWQRVEQVEEI